MRVTICAAMAGLTMLAGCGRDDQPVGENSAGSVRTTAIGTIVGTVPSATPGATPLTANASVSADDANTTDDDAE